MKRFYFVLLAMMMVACTQDKTDTDIVSKQGDKIYASISQNEGSRVQLNDNKQTVWTENDIIYVFNGAEISGWKFDGQTGDRSGTFTKYATGTLSSVSFDSCCAFYSSEIYGGCGKDVNGTPAIFARINSIQNYLKDSYGLHTNAMFGTSDDGVNFSFINLFGYLRLSIAGDKIVESIDLINNSGEAIAGLSYFFITDPYSFRWHSDQSDTITLDCGDEGVQLSSTPTDFYFVLPPSKLSEGITVLINFTDGSVYPQSTSKEITIARNAIQPMSVISTSGTNWQEVYITHSGNSITAPLLAGASSMSGFIYWGDNYMSLLGEADEYEYQDGEESHTITVQAKDANSIQIKNCRGISQIDLSNF